MGKTVHKMSWRRYVNLRRHFADAQVPGSGKMLKKVFARAQEEQGYLTFNYQYLLWLFYTLSTAGGPIYYGCSCFHSPYCASASCCNYETGDIANTAKHTNILDARGKEISNPYPAC